MILQAMRTDFNDKQFQEETYVKLSPVQDENSSAASNGAAAGSNTSISPADHEQLAREDLKYSVKIFLRSLEPELLSHTIDTSASSFLGNRTDSDSASSSSRGIERKLSGKCDDFLAELWCSLDAGRIHAVMACRGRLYRAEKDLVRGRLRFHASTPV